MLSFARFFLSSCLLVGCGGSTMRLPAGDTDVTGIEIDTYITPRGEVNVPVDLSMATIAAHVPRMDGGYDRIAGTGKADGTFVIPKVPAGAYLLQRSTRYVLTTSRRVDLSTKIIERPDAVIASDPKTSIIFNVTGLERFSRYDRLDYLCSGVGIGILIDQADVNPPKEGDSALAGTTVDLAWRYPKRLLIDPAKGDRCWLLKLAANTSSTGQPYQSVTRALAANQPAETNGKSTVVNGAMSAVAQTKSILFKYPVAKLAALTPQVNPAGTLGGGPVGLYLDVAPGSMAGEDYNGISQTILTITVPAGLKEDYDYGKMTYGNPFPADWPVRYGFIHSYTVSYSIKGAPMPFDTFVTYAKLGTVETLDGGAMAVDLSPVGNPQVNGKSAFAAASGIGTTPTLSWTAPEPGLISLVYATRLYLENGKVRGRSAAAFITSDSRLQIPDGILTAGESYFFTVYAVRAPHFDSARPNWPQRLPITYAPMRTALFTM